MPTTIARRTTGPDDSRPEVEVRVSARRTKSSSAQWRDGKILVTVPAHLSSTQRAEAVEKLVRKMMTKLAHQGHAGTDASLTARATALAARYVDGVAFASIRWVTNQNTRWGSCSIDSREIRLSHRLQETPSWVIDAVIVHELTHLLEANHTPAFHAIANRYPRQAEAHTFLAGYALGLRSAR